MSCMPETRPLAGVTGVPFEADRAIIQKRHGNCSAVLATAIAGRGSDARHHRHRVVRDGLFGRSRSPRRRSQIPAFIGL